ncbi:HWE histidine kinase domain-containing protein [Qipengyuania sp. CAU 1752]
MWKNAGMQSVASTSLPEMLEPILDTVLDAVIVLSKDGRVVAWNGVAEDTFGWSSEEACGQLLADLIVPEIHRAAHMAGMERLGQGGAPRVLNRRIELPALCKDGSKIPVELSITTSRGTGREFFIGFLRDISQRRDAEDLLRRKLREYEVMLEVTRIAGQADSFEDAMRTVLKTICEMTGWQAGHAFLVDRKDPDLLHASMIWHEEVEGCAAQMMAASDGLTFRRGEGLSGEVLETGAPVWLSDINLEGNFIRQGFEFRGAFGFPLRSQGRITAVLEFFSNSPTATDESQLLLAQALGSQLGRVIERSETSEQREVLLHELNHRNKNLLAVVQSMARITFSGLADPDNRLDTFNSRLQAMARAQDLLVRGEWTDSTLREVIEAALRGFDSHRDSFTLSGPDIPVTAAEVQTSVLTLHELCTNALKYGALSCEGGTISVTWGFEGEGPEREFVFEWQEHGCQLDGPPTQTGFGTNLLKRGLSQAHGSQVKVDYKPGGIHYRMVTPSPKTTPSST